MCKVPVAGRVKTRLCPPLTHEQAAGVQLAFLREVVRRERDTVFCHGPDDGGPALRGLLGDVRCLPQGGGDLGDRLRRARSHFEGQRVTIVGGDVPDPDPAALAAARTSDADVHLAPTDDGGFWAIGLAAGVGGVGDDALYAGVGWSSGRERGQVRANAVAAGYAVEDGALAHDVDDAADLRALMARLPAGALREELVGVIGGSLGAEAVAGPAG